MYQASGGEVPTHRGLVFPPLHHPSLEATYGNLSRIDDLGDLDLHRIGGGDGSRVSVGDAGEGRWKDHCEERLELHFCGGGLRRDVR